MSANLDPKELNRRLTEIFGEANVRMDEAALSEYAEDMTEAPPGRPDAAVKATESDQVVALVKFANETKIPIVPAVARTNLGGLTNAPNGGIVLDLTEMKRILAINPIEMYAIIEPGVTFGQISEYLERNAPQLRFGYPLSPPHTSVIANCLLDGLANFSYRHGVMSEWVNGLEAVLPTGETIRTGQAALSDNWCAREPLPDLNGLFFSWQGTTGVVTKASVMLQPNLPLRQRLFILSYAYDTAFEFMRRVSRLNIMDDIGGLSWPTGKMLFGNQYPPTDPDPTEPKMFNYLDFSGNDKAEIKVKRNLVLKLLKTMRKEGHPMEAPFKVEDLIRIDPVFGKFAEFPTTLDFLLDHPGGGLTWVGTYGPTSQWEEGARLGVQIMKDHGFPPTMVTRPMNGGHYGVLRFIELFDKKDPDSVDRVTRCNRALFEMCLNLGWIMYKTPPWAVEEFKKRMNPETYKLMQRIKKMMDPNGIMNPGNWGL